MFRVLSCCLKCKFKFGGLHGLLVFSEAEFGVASKGLNDMVDDEGGCFVVLVVGDGGV